MTEFGSRETTRRSFLSGLAGVGFISLSNFRQIGGQDASGWPMYQYGPGNSGGARNKIALSKDVDISDISNNSSGYASLVVGQERIFLIETPANVVAMDRSGSVSWSTELPIQSSYNTPAVGNGLVYVAGSTGEESVLYALSTDDGSASELFRSQRGTAASSPTLVDETVYYKTTSDENPQLFAVDSSSEELVWEYRFEEPTYNPILPAVDAQRVYSVDKGNGIVTLDRESGSRVWGFDGSSSESDTIIEGSSRPPTLTTNSVVYYDIVAGNRAGKIKSREKESGALNWEREIEGWDDSESALAVSDETVYITTDGTVYAFDDTTGDQRWTYSVSGSQSSSVVYAESTIYLISDNVLYMLDSDNGELVDKKQVDTNRGDDSLSMGLSNGEMYLVDRDGTKKIVGQASGATKENGSTASLTVFQRFSRSADSSVLLGALGVAGLGGGYLTYKKFRSETDTKAFDDTDSSTSHSEQPSDSRPTPPNVPAYDAIELQQTIQSGETYTIQQATVDGRRISVVTPLWDDSETVNSTLIERFSQIINHWQDIGEHPHVLSVFESEMEPIPWLAVEQATHTSVSERSNEFSPAEIVDVLQQLCEGVHHVYRYGISYENLTTKSVLYTDDGDVKLRGVLDQFDDGDPWYSAPEEFIGEPTEESIVYRIGVIAYELLTGTLPYREYPNGEPERTIRNAKPIEPGDRMSTPGGFDEIIRKALSESPTDRYETILHLRDDLNSVDSS